MTASPLLRVAGYTAWFWLCLAVSLYLTFPVGLLRDRIIDAAEQALGKGRQGRYGVDPEVEIGRLSLWRGTGVSLERVRVQLPSTDPDPGPTLDLEELNARVGVLSLLFGAPKVGFEARLYEGKLSGAVRIRGGKAAEGKLFGDARALFSGQAGGLEALELELDGIDLGRAPPVLEKVGVPMTGVLSGDVSLALGEKPHQEGKGKVDLAVKGITLGPGELEVPIPGLVGGLTVPLVDMGDLEAQIDIEKGKGEAKKLALTGRDFQAKLDVELNLNQRVSMSRLSGDGWFKISPEFLEQNGKFKTLLDFAGPLKRARDDDGRYHFALRGTLLRPGFSLGKGEARRGRR